ncbi:LysR family transcriptional regulator [Nitrospirillum iridis]|uniref:LysR family transcriptional regulator of beta-lactamase n=1 Tax=Nitrospirillum iridis TaxID=765888 RepID=A0A7X0AZY6_9PROT|nr:LysR family transcriptional regulator [Nitrospirillum iridis]MBB6252842.1 LysR family transcriptional regulator of beta-lactamase [Nitrospirillum iridis]
MTLSAISLNALRAFESASRHLSLTRAAEELHVTQSAVSHQVRALEEQLGVSLFRRSTKGLILTDEGQALAPTIVSAFATMDRMLTAVSATGPMETVNLGVVGTFAVGFLFARLADFRTRHPRVDLRIMTNNNKVDLWTESLDLAIRFGDGAWHGVEARHLMDAPMTPLCSPAIAATLSAPHDLARIPLLRSYRAQDWPAWLTAAGVPEVTARGPLFDASAVMVQAAIHGEGVALAPPALFRRELDEGRLVQPFALCVTVGSYWLTRLMSRPATPGIVAFQDWILGLVAAEG